MKREQLLTRMIEIYSFEHPAVIDFARLMERGVSTKTLEQIVKGHEEFPLKDWE